MRQERKAHLAFHIVLKMDGKDHRAPRNISRMAIGGMPMSGQGDGGDKRSRRDEQDGNPMSIRGKGRRGRDSRPKTHFAAAPDQ